MLFLLLDNPQSSARASASCLHYALLQEQTVLALEGFSNVFLAADILLGGLASTRMHFYDRVFLSKMK